MCKRGNRSQEGKVVFAEIMTENNFKSYETYKPIDKRRKTTDNLEFYTQKNVSFKKKEFNEKSRICNVWLNKRQMDSLICFQIQSIAI